jgi:hydroxymethylpyrimidine pyrophosphatase-like HAD family hydrolase
MVKLMKGYTKKRTAAIGDGGNDVAMILVSIFSSSLRARYSLVFMW